MDARVSIAIGSVASVCVIVALTTAVAIAGASGLMDRPGAPVTESAITVPGTAATPAAPQTPLPVPQTVVAPQPEELPLPEEATSATTIDDVPSSPSPAPDPQDGSRGAPAITVPGIGGTPPARGDDSSVLKERWPGNDAWRTYGSGTRDDWSWGTGDGSRSRHHSQR